MKTAREMFKELGYEVRDVSTSLYCRISYINYKTLSIIYFDYDKTIDVGNIIISYNLLQAINQQVTELGWNNVNITD